MSRLERAEFLTWTKKDGSKGILLADIVREFSDELEVEITEHPVEKGVTISDNARVKPWSLSFSIGVTQTPIETDETRGFKLQRKSLKLQTNLFKKGGLWALSGAAGAAVSSVFGGGGEDPNSVDVAVYAMNGDTDRINECHDALIDIISQVLPVTITFGGRVYRNLYLIKVSKTAVKPKYATFAIEARQIIVVETGVAKLPTPSALRAKAKKNTGKKDAKAAEAKVLKSAAKSLLDGGTSPIKAALGL